MNLKKQSWEAFVAGWDQSAEGYNAEYPGGDDVEDELREEFEKWWRQTTRNQDTAA